MEWLTRLERTVLGWLTKVPHLPLVARKWLGQNIWRIVLIGAIISAFIVLYQTTRLLGDIVIFGTPEAQFYVSTNYLAWNAVTHAVTLFFSVIETVLLAMAVAPLHLMQKKGWVLLFMNWLVNAISVVITALLTLSVFDFIMTILVGAIGLAISGYFLFEIHGQFAHVERSKGIRGAKK